MNHPPPSSPTAAIDFDNEQSWTYARKYGALLTPIPSLISTATELLWKDHLTAREAGTDSKACSRSTLNALRLIGSSGKLKAPIYFAATSLYPEEFSKVQEDDVIKALAAVLGPGMFSAVLAMVYLHRRLTKVCTHEYWQTLSKEMVLNMELGFVIGSAIPQIGPADGTLAGGIRYASVATLLLRDAEQFKKYRVTKRRQFDLAYEHSIWQCDHAQISAFLLSEFGIFSELRESSHAIRKFPDDAHRKVPPKLVPWRAVLTLIDGIKLGTDPAKLSLEFPLTSEQIATLKTGTEALFQGRTKFDWMFKTSQSEKAAEESAETAKK